MPNQDLLELEAQTIDLAKAAGRLLMRYRRGIGFQTKSDGTVQTPADVAAEKLVRRRAAAVLPEAGFLGEETYQPVAASGLLWVCDPLDGTTNYLRGLPIWGVSLAIFRDASPLVGVVHMPLLRETFSASLGNGARCNGLPILVSSSDGVQFSDVYSISSRHWADYALAGIPSSLRCLGSCAYHLSLLASGRMVGVWEHNPKVWDIAAGVLLVREAGGTAVGMEGDAYTDFAPALADPGRPTPTLAAANDIVLRRMQASMVAEANP
jgi:myo-inositol-1(or 4)-monophosphatase